MKGNWIKWVDWPLVFHNEAQRGIEEIWRAIQENRHPSLPDGVDTSEEEIVEMAEVVDEHGRDPERFLRILHQDAEAYDVTPEEVYVTDERGTEPYWPEGGFGLTVDEMEWLTDVCCDVAERAASPDDTYSRSPVERLSELCEFLQYAREIGVPPSVGRGDQ